MGNTGRSVMCKQGHGQVSGSSSLTLWVCKRVSAALASRWHVEKFCLRQQAAARKCDKSNKMYGSKTHPNKKHAHIWRLFFSPYGGGLYQVRGTENNRVYGLTRLILCSSLQLLCQGCSCAPSAFFLFLPPPPLSFTARVWVTADREDRGTSRQSEVVGGWNEGISNCDLQLAPGITTLMNCTLFTIIIDRCLLAIWCSYFWGGRLWRFCREIVLRWTSHRRDAVQTDNRGLNGERSLLLLLLLLNRS